MERACLFVFQFREMHFKKLDNSTYTNTVANKKRNPPVFDSVAMAFDIPANKVDNLTTNVTQATGFTDWSGQFGGTPDTSFSGGLAFPSVVKTVEKNGKRVTQVTSLHEVKAFGRDLQLRLDQGDALFALNTMGDMNNRVFQILPLWYLNFALQEAARSKLTKVVAARKRPIEDDWTDVFPTTVEEFIQRVQPFGCLESRLDLKGHSTNIIERRSLFHSGGSVVASIAHRGRMIVPNFWGLAQNGEEVGFAAVMVRNFYEKTYDVDGAVLENAPSNFEFLQVIPVWNKGHHFASHIMPFRPEHYSKFSGMGQISYDTTKKVPIYSYAETNGAIQFGLNKTVVAEIEMPSFEVGYYMRLGVVTSSNTKMPQENEIKRALRDFNTQAALKKRCNITLHLEPSMPLYKTI